MTNNSNMILLLISIIVVFLAVAFGLGSSSFSQTSWIDKESGDGPWVLPSGVRKGANTFVISDEDRIKNYDPNKLDIKKSTSSHKINFSTTSSDINKVLYDQPVDSSSPIKY